MAVLVLWAAGSAFSHQQLLTEYVVQPPRPTLGVRRSAWWRWAFATLGGDYAVAYRLTFLSGERVTIASTGLVRIAEYQRQAPPGAEVVAESDCANGTRLAGDFHLCPPE